MQLVPTGQRSNSFCHHNGMVMECLVRGAGTANRERAAGHLDPGSVRSRKKLMRVENHGTMRTPV